MIELNWNLGMGGRELKTIAVKHKFPILIELLFFILFGGIVFLGFYLNDIRYIIPGLITTSFLLMWFIYEYLLQKEVLLSANEDGIVVNGIFRKKELKWYEVGYIDFKNYHNRYFSFSYGKLIISIPNNKKIKVSNVAYVKMAYDKLLNAKKEHYEKVD